MNCILVTGGAGFIGSNFIRMWLRERPHTQVINLDKLTYAGHRDTLRDLEAEERHHFIQGDIADTALVRQVLETYPVQGMVNFAAESHVDRSISGPSVFIQTNIVGTQVLLEAARDHKIEQFVQVSTDEVYGSLGPEGTFSEDSPLAPSSPYSASKTSADLLALAWHHTFGIPVCITRCSNNYGPYQFPEKLIPLMVTRALTDQPLPVYGDGSNIRDWIHVEDHCTAVMRVLEQGESGRIYNIGADCEKSNIDLVRQILSILGKPESLIQFVTDRPGHDWRYAMNANRIRSELGWAPKYNFEQGLGQTIEWIQKHMDDWVPLKELKTRT